MSPFKGTHCFPLKSNGGIRFHAIQGIHFASVSSLMWTSLARPPLFTVKLPVSVLALEKLRRLNHEGLDRDTTMLTGSGADFQTEARSDESSPDGLPFLKNLGLAVYEVELERKRENTPDLSRFRFPDRDY